MLRKIKKLLHDPKVMLKAHLFLTFFWIAAIIPTLLWLKDSILWVAMMSLWANIASHWAAYQATETEVKLDNENEAKKA